MQNLNDKTRFFLFKAWYYCGKRLTSSEYISEHRFNLLVERGEYYADLACVTVCDSVNVIEVELSVYPQSGDNFASVDLDFVYLFEFRD